MFDADAAEALCRDVVKANSKLFAAFPDVSSEDLMQVAMAAVWRADETFRPGKGATWRTWASRHAKFRLIELYRTKNSHRRTHNVYAASASADQESGKNLCPSIEAVAERAVEAAEDMLPAYSCKFSPRRFTLPQLAACIMLRDQLNTSFRGVVMVLRSSPAIRDRMGLSRVPTHATLVIAQRTIRRKVRQLRKLKHEQPLGQHDQFRNSSANDTQGDIAQWAAR